LKVTSYFKLNLWCKYIINSCWLYAVATCKNHYVIFINKSADELIQGQITATIISVTYSYAWKLAFHNAQADIYLQNLMITVIRELQNLYRIISLMGMGVWKVIICVHACVRVCVCGWGGVSTCMVVCAILEKLKYKNQTYGKPCDNPRIQWIYFDVRSRGVPVI
jgi:hypothetical protein